VTAGIVLSAVLRDMLLTTGRQTNILFLFVIRITTVLIFLITNFVRNPSVSVRPGDVDSPSAAMIDEMGLFSSAAANNGAVAVAAETRGCVRSAFEPIITVDNFVATFIIDSIRCCFATYISWPRKVCDNDNETLSLCKIRRCIVRSLSDKRPSLAWLRVLRGQLYVNDTVLSGFFEEFSSAYRAASSGSRYVQGTGVGGGDGSGGGGADDISSFLHTSNYEINPKKQFKLQRDLAGKYEDFRALFDICKRAIQSAVKLPGGVERLSNDDDDNGGGSGAVVGATTTDRSLPDDVARLMVFSILACFDDRVNVDSLMDTDRFADDRLLSAKVDGDRRRDGLAFVTGQRDRSYSALMLSANFRLLLNAKISQRQIDFRSESSHGYVAQDRSIHGDDTVAAEQRRRENDDATNLYLALDDVLNKFRTIKREYRNLIDRLNQWANYYQLLHDSSV